METTPYKKVIRKRKRDKVRLFVTDDIPQAIRINKLDRLQLEVLIYKYQINCLYAFEKKIA